MEIVDYEKKRVINGRQTTVLIDWMVHWAWSSGMGFMMARDDDEWLAGRGRLIPMIRYV